MKIQGWHENSAFGSAGNPFDGSVEAGSIQTVEANSVIY